MDGLEQVKQEVEALALSIGELSQRFEQHTEHPPGGAVADGDNLEAKGLQRYSKRGTPLFPEKPPSHDVTQSPKPTGQLYTRRGTALFPEPKSK